MTPDSPEGRERLVRLEEKVGRNERQIEMLGPLPLQVGLIQQDIAGLREDLKERDEQIDTRFDRHERVTGEALEKLARSFENQITACSNAVGRVAEAQAAWQEAERKRREAEREKREQQERDDAKMEAQTATEKFIAQYGLRATIAAALIAAVASILNTVLS